MAVVKLGVTVAALMLAGCNACQPAASPPSDSQIYQELVDAGCLTAASDDIGYVTRERALANPPAWFTCLAGGGTVQSCGVPCSK